MFKKKVGSDACLVLDAEATLASTTVTVTIDQTFDYKDIVEASKTRQIIVRCYTTNATIITAFGNVLNLFCSFLVDASSTFECSVPGTNGSVAFTKNASTGVWSGTFSVS